MSLREKKTALSCLRIGRQRVHVLTPRPQYGMRVGADTWTSSFIGSARSEVWSLCPSAIALPELLPAREPVARANPALA